MDLDVDAMRLRELAGFLSEDERERAARFYFSRDRDRYIAGRGRLRELLGLYIGLPPDRVRFRYGPFGKPELAHAVSIFFNVSHSGHRALLGFSRSPLGVDLELLRPELVDLEVAEHFFAPAEVEALSRVPPSLQVRSFLACWTRKEAFVKAHGEGLSLRLQDFEVTLGPDEEVRLLRTAWRRAEASEWRLYDLSMLTEDSVAALAVRGEEHRIVAWPAPGAARS